MPKFELYYFGYINYLCYMAKFKVNGLKELMRDIDKMERNIPKEVDNELKKIAQGILNDAISRVPVDKGLLKASKFIEKIEGGYTIGFSASYAPYQEFGTGAMTEVPTGYEAFAMEFFVSGKGHGTPQPFLFPAFLKERDSIVDKLEEKLKEYLKQF